MKTKTYTVYKFNELPEEAKQEALNNYRDLNVDTDCWHEDDYLLDIPLEKMIKENKSASKRRRFKEAIDKATKKGYSCLFTYKTKYFDLDRGAYIQFPDLECKDWNIVMQILGLPAKIADNCYTTITKNNREYDSELEIIYNGEKELTVPEDTMIECAEERFKDLLHGALDELRKNYEYLTSDKAIIEAFEANDYDFTIDGKID